MSQTRYDAQETERMRTLSGAPLARFGQRASAFVLDLLSGGVLYILLVFGFRLLRTGRIVQPVQGGAADVSVSLDFFESWYSVLWWVGYFGLTTYLGKGQTPGKRLMGIRVVSLVHERLSLWHSVERALGYGASALEFGFGFAQYFMHPNHRTVHDRIAETIVVAEGRQQASAEPAGHTH